ncbi:phosphotransferase enzyme family protein [Paenibacillus xylanexedens]|uniref:phosphotransferase enzyme family protein n=1 Tax=Paenibacillus xylanexedens TaxID=528191 RepID=UPI0011A6C39F|nr:phosphotransferase [Paenibacillus xylanexedens]
MAILKILLKAADSFEFNVETLVFLSNSTNEVYQFTKGDQLYILRLTQKPHEYMDKIQAEVDWIYYLVKNGVRASLPIKTRDNQLTAIYYDEDNLYIATAFHAATGRFFDKNDDQYWGPKVFSNWGETMGRMHRLSKSYTASEVLVKRDCWSIRNINNPHLQRGSFYVLLEKLISLERTIQLLPRERDSFGLIHNDFHPYNFFIDDSKITVFDFDDSIYGWFSSDIAIAATHAVWWGVQKEERVAKNEFVQMFLHEFLNGYGKESHLTEYWIETIPMFMEYRNICSFFWWLDKWDGNESHLTEEQRNAINNAVKLIERGIPFDGCDIQI